MFPPRRSYWRRWIMLNLNQIDPIVDSMNDFFQSMLLCDLSHGQITPINQQPEIVDHITVKIMFTGYIQGILIFVLPPQTAMGLTKEFIGIETNTINDLVIDSVSEIANIVAGGAKARLHYNKGQPFDLSLPEVIKDNQFPPLENGNWLKIPFTCQTGPFFLYASVSMNQASEEQS